MKRFYHKGWLRVCAGILCVLSLNLTAGSLIGIIAMEVSGLYERTKEEVEEDVYASICSDYSVVAMTRYQDDFGLEELSETNFRYGVIQTDSIEGLDLNDKDIYEVCNFDRTVTEDMLHIYSCNMGEDTSFSAGTTLFDSYYIYNQGSYHQKTYPIEACYYVRNTKQMYYLADGRLYQENELTASTSNGEESVDLSDMITIKSGGNSNDGKQSCEWKKPEMRVSLGVMDCYLSDITITTSQELKTFGKVMPATADEPEYEEYSCSEGEIVTSTYEYGKTEPYYVLSYVNLPLETKDNFLSQNFFAQISDWDDQDFFTQVSAVINWGYSLRYVLYAVFLISLIVLILSFVLVMAGAGHRGGNAEVTPGFWEKIPLDVFAAVTIIVMAVLLVMTVYCGEELTLRLMILMGIPAAGFSEIFGLIFLQSLAVRFKLGKWWRNTICYKALLSAYRICRRWTGWLKKEKDRFSEALPLLWKAWMLMGALAFLELFGIVVCAYEPGVLIVLWLVEKAVLYGVITVCLLQMRKLQQESQKIVSGEVNSKMDTSRMFWEFKKHGDNLNQIREGIGRAVAEQMKSERFKTELITNVSHDIKTPLTSIINYVDLLEKEEIDNPTVREYLEVLSRQSTRLKKLIEDLMEASKASTGNLTVVYEQCDAHVMLTQTIGEFEEKLKAGQIELIVQGSKEPVMIQADPRHLWRIFENLMNNICKYAQPSTRAYVNIEKQDDTGRIIFRNISKYALNIGSEELMERFVRGDSSRNTEGSGLGLSIAQSLTDLMQGTFELVIDGDLFKVIVSFPLVTDITYGLDKNDVL